MSIKMESGLSSLALDIFCIKANTGKIDNLFGEKGRVDLRKGLKEGDEELTVSLTTPGVVFQKLLIIGSLVSENNPAASGDVRAFNADTGDLVWSFHTIPRPGEDGYESWEDKEAWKTTGGANSWSGLALDEETGLVFVPTGSATFDFYGGLRKGENLFANSILALDVESGNLKWYFQTVHHDLWDKDLPAPPNLVKVKKNGKYINAVAQITKTGFVFVLERETGKPLFKVEEKPFPTNTELIGEEVWPTQPIPVLPQPFARQRFQEDDINSIVSQESQDSVRRILRSLEKNEYLFQPPSEKGIVVFPGFDGGAEWGGAAFDSDKGWLFVNSNQVPWSLKMVSRRNKLNQNNSLTVDEQGKNIYLSNCMTCHGPERQGGSEFPSLIDVKNKYSPVEVLNIVKNGRGRMPAFDKIIEEEDKDALVTYLLNLKRGKEKFKMNLSNSKHAQLSFDSLMPYGMTGYNKITTPEGYPANNPPWGTLSAIDLSSGNLVWEKPLGEYTELKEKGIPTTGTENYGGPIITAGGLLFIAGTQDKKIRAFNKRTGELLWEGALPTGGFATPATYMVDHKQYVVIACGGGRFGNELGDSYLAFALP